jgi:AbrB family looped-hinge helix DNA binding protein
MMFQKMDFYGSVSVGERGQIVLPAKIRKEFDVGHGDHLLVVGTPKKRVIMLVKAEVLDEMMSNMNAMLNVMNQDMGRSLKSKE